MNHARALSHYSMLAAQAMYEARSEPESDDGPTAFMRSQIENAQSLLRLAAVALQQGNEVKASGYVDDAVIELRGTL